MLSTGTNISMHDGTVNIPLIFMVLVMVNMCIYNIIIYIYWERGRKTDTPWKCNSSPLKKGSWKTILSYWVSITFFRGELLNFREVFSHLN